MIQQFFGKEFRLVLACLAGYFLLAVLAFKTPFAGALVVATGLAALLVGLKRLEWGIAFAFAELFANSHGHLADLAFGGFTVSSRMAVFAGVMAAYAVYVLRRRVRLPFADARLSPFILLFAATAAAFALGARQNGFGNAFGDGNGYLYALYALPVLSARWDGDGKRLLLQTLAAGAAWVSVLSLGLLYVFTHFPEWMLAKTYAFIRDTRTGELTKMYGNLFRIFLQAQFSVIIAAFVLISGWLSMKMEGRERLVAVAGVAVASSVTLIGLSRSFWVGGAAGVVALYFLHLAVVRTAPRRVAVSTLWFAVGKLCAVLGLVAILLFPWPYRTGRLSDLSGLFGERTTDLSDAAISSRWNLLPEMLAAIKEAPVLGSGYGTIVAFVTDDPRVRAIYPDGKWRTYAFEWGWLDIWLKMGIAGVAAFAWLFAASVRGLWAGLKEEQGWLSAGLIACLALLAVTHVFSPYLNHPLGLGLLVFVLPFMKTKTPATEAEVPSRAQPSVAPAMSE